MIREHPTYATKQYVYVQKKSERTPVQYHINILVLSSQCRSATAGLQYARDDTNSTRNNKKPAKNLSFAIKSERSATGELHVARVVI